MKYGILLVVFVAMMVSFPVVYLPHSYGKEIKNLDIKYGDVWSQTLDLYIPDARKDKKFPCIIYVHGGGWSGGDKGNVAKKPSFFTKRGFVFVSVKHRFSPEVTYDRMALDVATAVKWIYKNAETLHIDQTRINLMGHSSGGHLIMLVGTNPKYLNSVGLSPNILKSLINLDGPLNITELIQEIGRYKKVFGNNKKVWMEASPITYATAKNLPPMFLVTRQKSTIFPFIQLTRDAGNFVRFFDCRTLSHSEVTKLIGNENAPMEARNLTNAIMSFLKQYNG